MNAGDESIFNRAIELHRQQRYQETMNMLGHLSAQTQCLELCVRELAFDCCLRVEALTDAYWYASELSTITLDSEKAAAYALWCAKYSRQQGDDQLARYWLGQWAERLAGPLPAAYADLVELLKETEYSDVYLPPCVPGSTRPSPDAAVFDHVPRGTNRYGMRPG